MDLKNASLSEKSGRSIRMPVIEMDKRNPSRKERISK